MTQAPLSNLRVILRARRAAAAYAQALPTLAGLNGGRTPPGMLHNLGYVALLDEDPRAAVRLFFESAAGYREVGVDRRGLAECVLGLAAAAARLNRGELAARLFGAAEATLAALGTTMTPSNRADYERGRTALAGVLAADRRRALAAAGGQLSLDEALELAAALRPDVSPPDAAAPVRPLGLTAREREVAALVARGLRNRQIAEELVITEKTAANHVQRVLDKLAVHSRAELAARAHELGLTD
jgi:DNA-binding CsgD family transcriptional regulator